MWDSSRRKRMAEEESGLRVTYTGYPVSYPDATARGKTR